MAKRAQEKDKKETEIGVEEIKQAIDVLKSVGGEHHSHLVVLAFDAELRSSMCLVHCDDITVFGLCNAAVHLFKNTLAHNGINLDKEITHQLFHSCVERAFDSDYEFTKDGIRTQ